MAAGRRIVIATFGSLGDLHPAIAIALGLRARGHKVAIATSEFYRARIGAQGLGFHPLRPDLSPKDPEIIKTIMDGNHGTEILLKHYLFLPLCDTYDDLTDAVRGADLLITAELIYAGPLVAEKTSIPWASYVLAPISLFSAYDPSVPPSFPMVAKLRVLGPAVNGMLICLAKWVAHSWSAPVRRLRAELGLPPGADPIFEGKHSPELVLALFSSVFGPPQPDWPPQAVATGFPWFEGSGNGARLPPELSQFLAAEPPPIIFTLGSAAVMDAGNFFEESVAAAQRLGRRAVLLIGDDPRNQPRAPLPEGMAVFAYAPYAALFPRAAAIVHHGGIGTTALALRAGRPMLVMPYSHDQPDNAARVVRLGVGRTIPRKRYTAERAAKELQILLSEPRYAARAAEVGRQIQAEDGVRTACDAIEGLLPRVR